MSLRIATTTLWVATLLLCSLGAPCAADSPPSDVSLRELITLARIPDQLQRVTGHRLEQLTPKLLQLREETHSKLNATK